MISTPSTTEEKCTKCGQELPGDESLSLFDFDFLMIGVLLAVILLVFSIIALWIIIPFGNFLIDYAPGHHFGTPCPFLEYFSRDGCY